MIDLNFEEIHDFLFYIRLNKSMISLYKKKVISKENLEEFVPLSNNRDAINGSYEYYYKILKVILNKSFFEINGIDIEHELIKLTDIFKDIDKEYREKINAVFEKYSKNKGYSPIFDLDDVIDAEPYVRFMEIEFEREPEEMELESLFKPLEYSAINIYFVIENNKVYFLLYDETAIDGIIVSEYLMESFYYQYEGYTEEIEKFKENFIEYIMNNKIKKIVEYTDWK